MSRWLSELAAALEGSEARGEALLEGVTHDSRRVEPRDLFCAIRGARGDGHDYVADALKGGAGAALVEHFVDVDIPQLAVPAVRPVLGPLSASLMGNPAEALCMVGVTGTDGKTTTSFLTEHALLAAGHRTGLIGTVETRVAGRNSPSTLTTPEAPDLHRVLSDMVRNGVDTAVMEVSSHGIDQHRIDGIRFDLTIFTNLSEEHLDYHGTVEHYWYTKAKLFQPDRSKRGIICVDGPWGKRMAAQAKIDVLTFGRDADAQYRLVGIESSLSGTRVVLDDGTHQQSLWAPLIGTFNADNIAAAYLAALSLGVDPDTAASGLASCPPVPGRFEMIDRGQPFLVVVDYAHTPDALSALIATARSLTEGRVIVVVGARGGRDRLKRPRTGRVAASADLAVLTADSPGREDPARIANELLAGTLDVPNRRVRVELDRGRAIDLAVASAEPRDVVLIVGRGHETSRRLGEMEVAFDDRESAAQALEAAGWTKPACNRSEPLTHPF